ncbi:ankyrin-2 [Cladorrhinum sp. PSN332]|nr:ankyrin-2 [Cladorrhinum sp. PSN332]
MATPGDVSDEYDFVTHDETALTSEDLARICEWLQPTDYLAESGEFHRHLSSQAPGTGLWICQTAEYQKWHDSSDHGSLWIKGVPGAGKSVTAASIVRHLQANEGCPVLFFFFRNIVAANFLPRALLQDWLAQLLPFSPKLQFALNARLDSSLVENSDGDLFQIFLEGISRVPRVYCVVDALDEMSAENRAFLDNLNRLARHRPDSLKLLITSRPKQYLQSALRDSSIVHISLQQQLVDVDIMAYLHDRFDKIPKSDDAAHVKHQLIDMVANRSKGLFLYAKLTMDQLEATISEDSHVDIHALEAALPVGLEQTYTHLLLKHREDSGISPDGQMLVLAAVTHASRPLRLSEMASLINTFYPDVTAPSGFKALISTCCGPLIEILEDETLQVIHHSFTEFLRGETRSENESPAFPIINSQQAHKRMAISCLRYLRSAWPSLELKHPPNFTGDDAGINMPKWKDQMVKEELASYQKARLLHPFLAYSMDNWAYHASQYDTRDEELFRAVVGFSQPENPAFNKWLDLKTIPLNIYSWIKGAPLPRPTTLHIAAFAGLSQLCEDLIRKDRTYIAAVDMLGRIPLHWAAENGHSRAVSVLIGHKSDPDPADVENLKPIHLAAWRGHASVVKVLCEAGVTPSSIKPGSNGPEKGRQVSQRMRGSNRRVRFESAVKIMRESPIAPGESAIFYATKCGHVETILAMIPFCATEMLEQLLCECCWFNRTDCVLAVLENSNVSADATYLDATALYYAVRATNVQCVEALIRRGADVCKTSQWAPQQKRDGNTTRGRQEMRAPLHELIHAWGANNGNESETILRMLVDAGADLEQPNGNGETALVLCFGSRLAKPSLAPVKLLLAAGADVNKTDRSGNNAALHLAVQIGADPEVILALLEHGSDPNRRGYRGTTALHSVAFTISRGHRWANSNEEVITAIVRLLLDWGADPSLKDDDGDSAVQRAIFVGPQVFRMLLSRCVDQSVKLHCWFNLDARFEQAEADDSSFSECVKLLLAEGIDINTKRDKDGRTLFLCCTDSYKKLLVLHQLGADPHAIDSDGQNALQLQVLLDDQCNRRQQFMQDLIADFGIDPLTTDNNGDTLLHHYARKCNRQDDLGFARWLLSIGVPVNATNNKGQTAMHVYLELGMPYSYHHPKVHFLRSLNKCKDVKFEIRDNDGLAPLHLAAMKSEVQFTMLAAAGADVSFLTGDGQNILHVACRARRASMLAMILVEHSGATWINQKDRFGRAPLHYASSSRDAESVALLLKRGADVHVQAEDGSTPLHACAMSTIEQSLWNVQGLPSSWSWLKGPPVDPFRPSGGHVLPCEPGLNFLGGCIRPTMSTPAAGTVAKMLLDAGSDPTVLTSTSRCTALVIALYVGCADFVEVFAQDEKILERTLSGQTNNYYNEESRCSDLRTRLRAHVALAGPRPCLDHLWKDRHILDEILKSPVVFLDLLTPDDMANVVNHGFNAAEASSSWDNLFRELMMPGRLEVARRVPQLILHYSDILDQSDNSPLHTALQLACQTSGSNMEMVKLLVEKLKVDIDAQFATVNHNQYNALVTWDMQIQAPEASHAGTALHLLALADHYWQLEAMRYLIAKGADVNAVSQRGQTPLHVAAQGPKPSQDNAGSRSLEALRILLAHGADPNLLDKQGRSPLAMACSRNSDPEIVRELLREGADPNAGIRSPLFEAIYSENLAPFEIFFEHDGHLNLDCVDESYKEEEVNLLLRFKADQTPRKLYALLASAFPRSARLEESKTLTHFRALVQHGANLYLPINEDETLIHLLFQLAPYNTVDSLLKTPCVEKIDFNRRDQHGRSVLMAACNWRVGLPNNGYHTYNGMQWEASIIPGPPIRILDSPQSADATLIDNNGKTALHHLLCNPNMPESFVLDFASHPLVAPTLLVRDNLGFSPLQYALRLLRPKVCSFLISNGANILEADPDGMTVLHRIAAQCIPKSMAKESMSLWNGFLAAGGDINAADKNGNTPLLTYLSSQAGLLPRGAYNSDQKPFLKWSHPSTSTVEPAKEYDAQIIPAHVAFYPDLFGDDKSVDMHARNAEGETVLHLIAWRYERNCTPAWYEESEWQVYYAGEKEKRKEELERYDAALVEMMLKRGVDPLVEDGKGKTVGDVASACGREEILEVLRRQRC